MKNKLSILFALVLSLAIAGSTLAYSNQTTPPKNTTTNSKMSNKTVSKKMTKKHRKHKKHSAKRMKTIKKSKMAKS